MRRPAPRALAGALLALGTLAAPTQAQTPGSIRVGENVYVDAGFTKRPLTEPHIAVHPSNPNHLLAATIVGVGGAVDAEDFYERLTCAVLHSLDGGKTWERKDFGLVMCGDPWVAIGPDGHAVFTALARHPALPHQDPMGLVVFHSADGGRSWDETPVGLGTGHDHQTIAVDMTSPGRRGWMYVLSGQGIRGDQGKLRWSVYVARTRNGGETFDEPVKILPSNLNLNTELPAVLSDGTLVVSFRDFQRNTESGFLGGGLLERYRTWVMRSTDGGATFSIPLFVSEACGRGWIVMAADTSAGPYRDRLYLACRDRDGGAILLHHSADGGEICSDPVRGHAAPADSTVDRAIPAVTVNRNGVVGISWLDGRAKKGCHEMYFTASLDGGRTFLPEQRVSSATSCPDPEANGVSGKRWESGGDYYGLAPAPDGRFRLFWADARHGLFQLFTAAVEVQGRVVAAGEDGAASR